MLLSTQRQAELAFWRGLVEEQGEFYYAYRVAEYRDKVRFFPSYKQQKGLGADIGCGCVSIFEGATQSVDAFDVLAEAYGELLRVESADDALVPVLNCPMMALTELEGMPNGRYAWLASLNMIDHTPDPMALIQEMHRVLVPDGRLYFEVNLERGLAPPHYTVWDESTVSMLSGFFRETFRYVQDVPEHNQRRYWAEFERL